MAHSLLKLGRLALKTSDHRITTTMHRRINGYATDVENRPLNKDKAAVSKGNYTSFWVALGALVIYQVHTVARRNGRMEGYEAEKNLRAEKKEEIMKSLELLRQELKESVKKVELLNKEFAEIVHRVRGYAGASSFGGNERNNNPQGQEANP